jgi:hypothetical protein
MKNVTNCVKFIVMELNTIQILALIFVVITCIKLFFFILKRNSFNSFIQSYKTSVNNNSWLYFSIYLLFSLLFLYLIRTYSDITYTEILACCMFIAFLINAGIMGTSIIEHYDLSKINWKMMFIYLFVWLFIMFKSIQEIFNF